MIRIPDRSAMMAGVLGLALGSASVDRARADLLVMTDGTTFYGEVIEETSAYVAFRSEISGIWSTMKYPMVKVESVLREDGDQSGLGAGKEKSKDVPKPKTGGRPAPSGAPKVAVIPLHGSVGGIAKGSVSDSFDAGLVNDLLNQAERDGVMLVVLDINSPGGLVSEMEEICRGIIQRHDRMRIVAYAHEAFSAAAIISLSCRELVVHPSARVGAAVIIKNQGKKVSAVDAKMASPHYALQREFMTASGRPYDVVAAMAIQETQLWWSPTAGFTTDTKTAASGDWKQIDTASTILTMTGSEAIEYGLAVGQAANVTGLLSLLKIRQPVEIVDFAGQINRYNAAMDRRLEDLRRQLNLYFESLGDLVSGMNSLADAYNRKDKKAADKAKADISRQVTRMRTAASGIRKSDKSLLARRVDVPDDMLSQLQTDSELLGRIDRILSSDTYEGFNEARERVIKVLDAWRKILGT